MHRRTSLSYFQCGKDRIVRLTRSMDSLNKGLLALGCPFSSGLDLNDRTSVVKLVRWLEDRKVRELDIEERNILADSPSWDENFGKYLTRIGCPLHVFDSTCERLSWLISYALSLEYEDNNMNESSYASKTEGDDEGEIIKRVDDIGSLLGMTRSTDESNTAMLGRIYRHLKCNALEDAQAARTADFAGLQTEGLLQQFPLGFDTVDEAVNQVAVVLRMLYLSDFRDLQNEVNALLVLVQEQTANPRLNTALGRVGT